MNFLFGGVASVERIVIVGTLSYLSLLLLVRLTGQRPLARMQTFDLIVSIALGSTFGRLLTAQEVQFSEALVAFLVLLGLHFVVAWATYRFPLMARVLEVKPVLLYYRGEFQRGPMRRHRVTPAELEAAARKRGLGSLQAVGAVVLESDGSMAVLAKEVPLEAEGLLER